MRATTTSPGIDVFDGRPLHGRMDHLRVQHPAHQGFYERRNALFATTALPLAAPSDAAATAARAAGMQFLDFLRDGLGRNGIDDAGGGAALVVHFPYHRYVPGVTAGTPSLNDSVFDAFAGVPVNVGGRLDRGPLVFTDHHRHGSPAFSRRIVAHELAHGVFTDEVRARGGSLNHLDEWAINEAWADVMAHVAVPGDWRRGDGWEPGFETDLARPTWTHVDAVPTTYEELEGSGFTGSPAHALATVLALPAVELAKVAGDAAAGTVWYRAITDHLPDHPGRADLADAVQRAAVDVLGAAHPAVHASAAAWRSIGVTA
ncbi:MAG: Peptidase [Thermoleophilia bacterium]|nr:Peptidase [Thermoleophilia bacterium]